MPMNPLHKSIRLAIEWLFTPITMLPAMLRTYRQLFDIFSGAWERREGKPLWCFSGRDIAFRGWYEKIARDFALRGRFGYAWDNGAGDNLGGKIYNNFVTYWLYGKLGTRLFHGAAICVFALALSVSAWIQFGFFVAALTLFFFLPSPFVVVSLLHLSKPECLFWGFSLIAMLLLLSGWYISAGMLWSCIAFCNLPAAAMCGIFMGPIACVQAFCDGALVPFLFSIAPGAAKTLWRIFYMLKAGTLSHMCAEQVKMASISPLPLRWECVTAIPIVVSLCLCPLLFPGGTVHWAACSWILFSGWLNDRLIRYNDKESVRTFMAICAFALATTSCNICSYAVLLYLLYPPIQDVDAAFPQFPGETGHAAKCRTYRRLYPNLAPRPYNVPNALQSFFSHIPKYSRIIAEYDGDPRSGSPMRAFWSYLDMFRANREINLFNDMYLRPFAPQISSMVANRFSPDLMSAQEMSMHLHYFGIKYIIAYTDAMCTRLDNMACKYIATVFPVYSQFLFGYDVQDIARMHQKMHLFRTDIQDGIISDTDTFTVDKKILRFIAEKGKAHTVRLLYSPQFHVLQAGKELPFSPAAHPNLPCEPFISLPIVDSGPVTLTHTLWGISRAPENR